MATKNISMLFGQFPSHNSFPLFSSLASCRMASPSTKLPVTMAQLPTPTSSQPHLVVGGLMGYFSQGIQNINKPA